MIPQTVERSTVFWQEQEEFKPSKIRREIQTFAGEAKALAKQILGANTPNNINHQAPQPPVVIRQYYTPWYSYNPWYSPFWEPRTTVYVHTTDSNCRSSKKDSKDGDGSKAMIALVSLVVVGVVLFTIGSTIPRYNDAANEQSKTEEFLSKLEYAHIESKDEELVAEAITTATLKNRICSRIKNSALGDLALRTTMLVGSGLLFAGAMSYIPGDLMTTGLIIAGLAAGGMLFKWGFDSNDNQNVRDANSLRQSVKQLKAL